MPPKVEVIAYTSFLGVPRDLAPSGFVGVGQDIGVDAERLIECAGRTCYDSYGKGRSSTEFHKHILEVGHGSVLEHASISFFITNVSRGLTHELVRHRIGVAISQRSTRYVDEIESDWCWHPLIASRCSAPIKDAATRLANQARYVYIEIVAELTASLIADGVDKFTARKQARGAARGALGNALSTELVWTTNIRNLRNVLEQRASAGADAEIRLLANALYEAALEYCPEYLSDYEKQACPDGIGYALTTKFRKV